MGTREQHRRRARGDADDVAQARMLLGVTERSTPSEINAAFRRIVLEQHPDRGGGGLDAATLVQARELCVDAALTVQTAPTRRGTPLGGARRPTPSPGARSAGRQKPAATPTRARPEPSVEPDPAFEPYGPKRATPFESYSSRKPTVDHHL